MAPGSLQRSVASRPSSIAAAAPDPTEPKPCSRLLICLQINQQTIAGETAARKAALTGGLPLKYLLATLAQLRAIFLESLLNRIVVAQLLSAKTLCVSRARAGQPSKSELDGSRLFANLNRSRGDIGIVDTSAPASPKPGPFFRSSCPDFPRPSMAPLMTV
jgi:hypothetical protein